MRGKEVRKEKGRERETEILRRASSGIKEPEKARERGLASQD